MPQATFLSLINEGGRPWVVTDTGSQKPQDTLPLSGRHLPRVSCEQVWTPPQTSRSLCPISPQRPWD